jgi:6-phosphofructokinase 1
MTAFQRKAGAYAVDCTLVDVNEVCNQEKEVPLSWITEDGSDLGREFIDYAAPLIQGECSRPMKDGLPVFAVRSKKQA